MGIQGSTCHGEFHETRADVQPMESWLQPDDRILWHSMGWLPGAHHDDGLLDKHFAGCVGHRKSHDEHFAGVTWRLKKEMVAAQAPDRL